MYLNENNHNFLFWQGLNERKVGFSMEEEDEEDRNDSESEEIEKLHPIKLHRR